MLQRENKEPQGGSRRGVPDNDGADLPREAVLCHRLHRRTLRALGSEEAMHPEDHAEKVSDCDRASLVSPSQFQVQGKQLWFVAVLFFVIFIKCL